ncbi:MAG TPA: hypothetical protein VKC60_01940 [Opitutaceae bacterium]|nr:hypothetical protein [Opitutaceae bacterium]
MDCRFPQSAGVLSTIVNNRSTLKRPGARFRKIWRLSSALRRICSKFSAVQRRVHIGRSVFGWTIFHRTIVPLAIAVSFAGNAHTQTCVEFDRALALYRLCRYSEAQTILERIAVDRPNDPELNFYRGRLALWFDDDAKGRSCLEKAAQEIPNDARIQNALGDAFGLAAQHASLFCKFDWAKKCKAAYERAIELDPQNPDYHWSLMGYYQLAPRIVGGGFDKAFAQAAEIRRLDPMSGRVAFATLYLCEKKYAEAFAQFDEVLETMPDNFIALYQIGRCAAVSGKQLDRGFGALKRCLLLPGGDGTPKIANVHYRMGNILERKGDMAAAHAEYDAAIQDNPDFRPAKEVLRH